MKVTNHGAHPTALGLLFIGLFGLLAHGQEALRDSITSERAAEARKQMLENQSFNLKLGPVKFIVGATLDTEFNDNINLSDSDADSDVILRPQVQTLAVWPVTQVNALTFSLGLGYVKYISHNENDSFLMTPGSILAFDVFVKDFHFQFFDQFSYSLDPLNEGSVSGTTQYGGFQNNAGLTTTWDLNEAMFSATYSHNNFLTDTSEFQYLDRESDRLVLRATFLPNATVHYGVEVSGEMNRYTETQTFNDSDGYSFGGFGDWRLSPHLRIAAHAGYTCYSFDDNGTAGSSSDSNGNYFGVSVDHQVNESFSHSLEASHQFQLGVYSDALELFTVRYGASWKVIRNVGLSAHLFYERGECSDTTYFSSNGQPVSLAGEAYNRLGVEVSLGYQLMKKLSTSLTYRFTWKDSDVSALDYLQNALSVGLTYRF